MSAPSPICYVELPAPDCARVAGFYRDVFGWSVESSSLSSDPYWSFSAGPGLSGAFDARKAPSQRAGVLLYLAVDDIDVALAAVERHGGAVVKAKRPVGGDFGFFAEFHDPAGNLLGLWCKT